MTVTDSDSSAQTPSFYRVLARKYRPVTFQDILGQEPVVRVLTHAIEQNRLPHAFILTGIRGVGKTTIARVIARALNCVGPHGEGQGPTVSPCGVCAHCEAIGQDSHLDVVEMDAASRTSVEDVRSIIEGARYKPVSGRFKVYIVDEVHMLSKNAFNAFLKTLEEPPPHVKFIFATTELRKVLETVLSRCMRLPLQRLELSTLKTYFEHIIHREQMTIEPEAATLLARAADGSMRDGLSFLDQAISLCGGQSGITVTEKAVLEMLGISDRGMLTDLLEACFKGEAHQALSLFERLYLAGSDPVMVVQDLLALLHWMMIQKMNPTEDNPLALSQDVREKIFHLLTLLPFPTLSRFWQVLTKGLQEVTCAPSSQQGVDVLLLRLCYLAPLPTPAELVNLLRSEKPKEKAPDAWVPPLPIGQKTDPSPAQKMPAVGAPSSFEGLVSLLEEKREMLLKACLENDTHLISYEPGHIRLKFSPRVPKETLGRLRTLLNQWTGLTWNIEVGTDPAAPSLREQREKKYAEAYEQARADPLVEKVLTTFPGSELKILESA